MIICIMTTTQRGQAWYRVWACLVYSFHWYSQCSLNCGKLRRKRPSVDSSPKNVELVPEVSKVQGFVATLQTSMVYHSSRVLVRHRWPYWNVSHQRLLPQHRGIHWRHWRSQHIFCDGRLELCQLPAHNKRSLLAAGGLSQQRYLLATCASTTSCS